MGPSNEELERQWLREVCMDAAPLVGQPKYLLRIPWQQYVRSVTPAKVLRLLDTIDVLTARLLEYGGMRAEQAMKDAKLEDDMAMIESLEREWGECRRIAVDVRRIVRSNPKHKWPREIEEVVARIEQAGFHRFDEG